MKESIVNSIKSLPPLSKTIMDINKVFADEEAGVMDLAKVIENDPMIVANLLKAANSPLYGFSKEIKNVSQAVSLFGMSMTRSIALGNSVRKLLNVDMKPYGITSEEFAEISAKQSALMMAWYKQVNKEKADKLFLASFLQETGKILIASDVLQGDEVTNFISEIEMTNNLAAVEKEFSGVTSSEITAKIFEHWKFDNDFIEIIKHADAPSQSPKELKEYSVALHIVKTIVPINHPFSELAINLGLKKAQKVGYDVEKLKKAIEQINK